jgi:hypothetical protein
MQRSLPNIVKKMLSIFINSKARRLSPAQKKRRHVGVFFGERLALV